MSSLDEIISQYDPDVNIPGDKILPYVSTVYVINDTLYTVTNKGQVTNLGRYSGLPGRFIDNASILPNGRLALDIFGVGEWVSPTSVVGMRNIQMTNKGLGLFTGVTDTELNHKTVAWDSTFKVVNAPTDFKVSLAGDGGYDTELLHPDRYAEFNLGVGGVGLVHNPLGLDFTTDEVILTAGVYHIELNYSLVSEATLVLGLGLANSITPLQRIFANADASASGKLVEIITVDTPTVIRLINYSPKPTLHVSSQYATLRIHHLKPTTVGSEPSHNSYNAFSFKVKNNRLVNVGSYPVLLNFNQNATSFVDGGFLLSGASIGSFNFGVSIGSGEFNLSFTYTHKAAKGSTIQTVLTDAVTAANFSLEHDNTKEHLQLFLNGTLAEINTTHIKTNQPTHVNFVRNAQGILKTYVEGCLAGVYRYNAAIPTNAFNLGGLGASGKVQAQINDLTLTLSDRWLTRNVNPVNQSKYALPAPLATLVENQSNFRGIPTGLVETYRRGAPVTVNTNTYGLTFTGTRKYGNPALAVNNRIYFTPFDAKDVLVIDPTTNTAVRETYGVDFPTVFEYISAVATPNGKVYFAPNRGTAVLVVDVLTNTAVKKTYGLTFVALGKFSQGVYHAETNRVYFPPMGEGQVLVIDVTTDTATLTNFGLNLTNVSFGCSTVGKDGKIYCLPKNATNILVITPSTDSAVLTNFGTTIAATDDKHMGCVRVDNKIYSLPHASGYNSMLILDTDAGTLTFRTLTGLSAVAKWIGGYLNVDGNIYFPPYGGGQVGIVNTKNNDTFSMSTLGVSWPSNGYWGGVVDSNFDYYLAPSDATLGVRVVNGGFYELDYSNAHGVPVTVATNTYGLGYTGTNKYGNPALASDNRIYVPPFGAKDILVIDPITGTATRQTFGQTFPAAFSYISAVATPDGKVYFAPDGADHVLVIDTVTNTAVKKTYGLTFTASFKMSQGVYHGATNRIYFPPMAEGRVLVIDCAADTATLTNFGLNLTGVSFGCSAVGKDNKVYCLPKNATNLLVIDPAANSAVLTNLGTTIPSTDNKFFGCVRVNNKIFALPFANGFNSMAIIDTDTQTLQLVALTGLPAANKWTAGFLNSDGNIYFPPYGGGQVGVVNALTNQFSMTTLSASWPNNGYWGGAADSNGNYHMAPSDATIGVRSFVADITATKFVDLVPAANRFVYAIPSYFRTFIRIDTQLNRATINAYGRTFSGPNRFGGAIELGNLLYVIPDQHTELLIINVTTDTLVQALTTTGYGKPIYDAKRNLIYAPPVNGSNFLILNPTTRTISVSNFGLAGISGGYRSIVNLTDDLYYAVPMQATQGILIDLQTQTASFSSLGATLPAGAHRFNKTVLGADNRWYAAPLQNTTHEWLGINRELPIGFNTVFGLSTAKGFTITNAFTGPDGYTYFGISDGTFYRLNTETHEVTETNLGLPADSSSGGASCIGPDNKLYVAPHLGSNGFRVHTFNPA